MPLATRKMKTEAQNHVSGEGIIETSFDIVERKGGNTLNIDKEIVNNVNNLVVLIISILKRWRGLQ